MRWPNNRADNDGWAAANGAANVACRYPSGRAESTNPHQLDTQRRKLTPEPAGSVVIVW